MAKTNAANKPKTAGSGEKFGFLSVPAKAGTFNSVAANTSGKKKGK